MAINMMPVYPRNKDGTHLAVPTALKYVWDTLKNKRMDYVLTDMENSIALQYDPTKTYAVGDYRVYNDILYKCNTAVTVAGAFNASKWTVKDLATELAQINTNVGPLSSLNTTTKTSIVTAISWLYTKIIGIVALEFSPSSTYALGTYCLRDAVLYRCTTAITVAEAWNIAHWTAATLGGELNNRVSQNQIARGTAVVNVGPDSPLNYIDFGKTFVAPPTVVVTQRNNTAPVTYGIIDVNNSAFTVQAGYAQAATISINWLAISS